MDQFLIRNCIPGIRRGQKLPPKQICKDICNETAWLMPTSWKDKQKSGLWSECRNKLESDGNYLIAGCICDVVSASTHSAFMINLRDIDRIIPRWISQTLPRKHCIYDAPDTTRYCKSSIPSRVRCLADKSGWRWEGSFQDFMLLTSRCSLLFCLHMLISSWTRGLKLGFILTFSRSMNSKMLD